MGKKSTHGNGQENILNIVPRKILNFADMATQLSGEIFLKIKEADFSNEFAKKLMNYFNEHPGKFGVHITLQTEKFKTINLHPRTIKIFPGADIDELFEGIEEYQKKVNLNFN